MDMERLIEFLSPFLPFLITLNDKASEGGTEKFGEGGWSKAKAIWLKLQPEMAANADLKAAVEHVAAKLSSEARHAVLKEELEALFNNRPDLAQAIAQLLQADVPNDTIRTQIIQTVTGNQNQVIGQVSGGQIFNTVTEIIGMDGSASPAATPSVKTILVLAANPKGTNSLRLGEEVRKIQIGLERSQYRDRFRIEQRWAVTPTDVRRALLDCHPQIVHFSMHGIGVELPDEAPLSARKLTVVSDTTTQPEGLLFEDETGQPKLVSAEAIANLFSLFADRVECVVLNACYSATQANAIAQQLPYVVGMKRAIGDQAAIEFAIGFYDALLAGESIEFAHKLGCNAIQMEGIAEHLTPVLHRRPT